MGHDEQRKATMFAGGTSLSPLIAATWRPAVMKARLALLISGPAQPPGSESGRQGDVTRTRTGRATHALLIEEKSNFLFIFFFYFFSLTLRGVFHFHSFCLRLPIFLTFKPFSFCPPPPPPFPAHFFSIFLRFLPPPQHTHNLPPAPRHPRASQTSCTPVKDILLTSNVL